jgi:hypothetical protein
VERKINYFLASWSGPRLHCDAEDYLHGHLDKLNNTSHNLSQVSIGCPENPDISPSYLKWLDSLESLDDGTPIVVYHMPNEGLSYGQYSYMFDKCRDQFSHYILMEDDYLPVAGNFDTILADWFDDLHASENCGFLCGLVLKPNNRHNRPCDYIHAAVSNGITNNEVLNTVWNKFGRLPSQKVKGKKPEQVVFSQGFTACHYKLCDVLERYRCVFHKADRGILWSFGDKEEDLMVPIQFFWNPMPKLVKIAYRPPPAKTIGRHRPKAVNQ